MTGIRRAIGLLFAVLLALVATPTLAQNNKSYVLQNVPSTIGTGNNAPVAITVLNNSPVTNSNYNSFKLTAPPGITILAASEVGTTYAGTPTISADHKSVSVLGISPSVGRGNGYVISLTLAGACSGGGQWGSEVWGGSNLNGSPFANTTTTAAQTTTISGGTPCSLQFVPGRTPQNATINLSSNQAYITSLGYDPSAPGVQVAAINGNSIDATFAGSVTLTVVSPSGATLGGATVQASNGIATFGNINAGLGSSPLSATTAGSYTVQATTTTTNYQASGPASFTVQNGILDCSQSFSASTSNGLTVNDSGYAAGTRNASNKDGNTCVIVNYDFENHIFDSPSYVNLQWDTGTQPFAAFSYTVTWKTESVDSTGWPVARHPLVAWKTDTSGNPIYVPALACLSPSGPAPYGNLVNAIDATTTTITLSTTTGTATLPTSTPFPIVIGTERMKVTAVSGSPTTYTLTVVRGDGQTTAAPHSGGTTTLVMSTPLPVDPNPSSIYYQQQVHMCAYEHGWTSAGPALDPVTGRAQIRYSTSVWDIGDGWLSLQ